MSKTVLCVLLKVLISVKADILPKDPDSDLIQDNPVSENNDCAVIPECIENILSKPTSPRAFVEFYNGFLNEKDNISVTFRWNQPESTDEIIQGYTVQCWFIENLKKIQICDDKSISATILECTVHDLKPNTTYYFQVRAHTKVGAGPYTDLFNVSTKHENRIPQLLTVSNNGIEKCDLDSNISVSLVERNGVLGVAYSIAEHKIYWSNTWGELMMLDMNKNNTTKIAELNKFVFNLYIDWVTNNLYWMDYDSIIKFDLTMWENGINKFNRIPKKTANFYAYNLNILPSMGYVNFYPFEINN